MRAVLASILWTALSATLLSVILLRADLAEFPPAALVVMAGYAALALSAIRPRRFRGPSRPGRTAPRGSVARLETRPRR